MYWIDTFLNDGTIVKQTGKPLRNTSESSINSYDGHQFVVKFLHDIPGVEAFFTKGPKEETVVISYDEEKHELKAKQITKFDEIMALIDEATRTCSNLTDAAFSSCIGGQVMEEVVRLTETTKEVKRFRDIMSPRLREYVCKDPKVNASVPLRSDPFSDRNQKYYMDMFVDTERAKVWTVKNAVSPRECAALDKHKRPVESASIDAMVASSVITAVDGSSIAAPVESPSEQLDLALEGEDAQLQLQRFTYQLDEEFPDQDLLW